MTIYSLSITYSHFPRQRTEWKRDGKSVREQPIFHPIAEF